MDLHFVFGFIYIYIHIIIMPIEEDVHVKSILFKEHEYVTNIHSIEEKNYESYLYKTTVHFNELSYPVCIAIGDLKKVNEELDYKYVYAVKYSKVVGKLGMYEFIKGSDTSTYDEGQLLLFDNYADRMKLDELVQTKEEYITTSNKTKNILIEGILSGKYETLKLQVKGHTLNTLNFYNDLHTKGENIKDIEFINSGVLNQSLIERYKEIYASMSYNDVLRMILGDDFPLLEALDEFERSKSNKISPNEEFKEEDDEPEEVNLNIVDEVGEGDKVGDEDGDDKELTILNRRISWKDGVIEYEADKKHVEVILEELGLEVDSKGLEAPMERSKSEDVDNEETDEPMEDREATKFRGIAARANYLSLDRVDNQFAAKEICRRMSKPRKSHWGLLMRLGRYLLQYPRLVWKFTEGGSLGPEFLDVYSDSDWAGDKFKQKVN